MSSQTSKLRAFAALAILLSGVVVFYQNCGGFQALGPSSLSSESFGVGAFSTQNPPGMESGGNLYSSDEFQNLKNAEAYAADKAQDPSRSVHALFQDRGLCVVRGGAGKFLAPMDYTTRASCEALCGQMTANVNRVCIWRNQSFVGNPELPCLIRGGVFATRFTHPNLIRASCQAECDRLAAEAPYRTCDWGDERLHEPPKGVECRVDGGAGVSFLARRVIFSSRQQCQEFCDLNGSAEYRTCRYGDEILRHPDENSKCEILGGAGVVLRPIFYGSRVDCSASCESFPQNPNRLCYHGKERIR